MTWGFLWLMLVLKIPIAGLLWIVWWAIHQEVESDPDAGDDGGGTKVPPGREPAIGPSPFPRRRGPHGDPVAPPPARVRTTVVRGRDPEHS